MMKIYRCKKCKKKRNIATSPECPLCSKNIVDLKHEDKEPKIKDTEELEIERSFDTEIPDSYFE